MTMTMTSTKKLKYDAKKMEFSGRIGDVRLIPICALSHAMGIRIVSEETGKQAVYTQQWTELDADGKVSLVQLVPTKATKEAIPELRGTKIKLVA